MNEEDVARDDITEVGEDHDVDGKLLAIEEPNPIGEESVSDLKKQKDDKAHFALLNGVAKHAPIAAKPDMILSNRSDTCKSIEE